MFTRPILLALLCVLLLSGCGSTTYRSVARNSAVATLPTPPPPKKAVLTPPTATIPTPPVSTPGVPPAPLLKSPPIVARMIPLPASRKNEMRLYSLRHYGINSYQLGSPRLIVEHFTETANFSSVYNTFAPDFPDSEYHELPNTCSHFVVDTDGTIYQLVPLSLMCRSVVGLNYTALAIENVGFSDQQILGNPQQLRASLNLTHWLRCRYHIPVNNVIGHNESLSSPYYHELVPAFRGRTHSDFNLQDMNVYRQKLQLLPCP